MKKLLTFILLKLLGVKKSDYDNTYYFAPTLNLHDITEIKVCNNEFLNDNTLICTRELQFFSKDNKRFSVTVFNHSVYTRINE